jgi:remodeling and spacing factor 1
LITRLSGGKLGLADLEKALLDDDSTQSQDDEDEEQPDDILLDTGQPEDAMPPGLVNGSHKKKKKKRHEKHENDNDDIEMTDDKVDEAAIKTEKESVDEKSDLKRKSGEGELNENKKVKDEEPQVGEAIEEPVLLIKGEGSGADCEAEFGEAIEEPMMFFCGVGAGAENCTGNPGDSKEEEKKPEKPVEAKVNSKDDSPSKSAVSASRIVNFLTFSDALLFYFIGLEHRPNMWF